MSEKWAERERLTNQVVRIIAEYLFAQPFVSPDQMYGLCKLTWITSSYSSENASYIRSTKIPALVDIFGSDCSGNDLNEVAENVSNILHSPEAAGVIRRHTGFTKFYGAYRNTARDWIAENYALLLPLFKAAYRLESDDQGLRLVQKIQILQGVPKANYPEQRMRPENLLTPVFFALDPRLRFPLINGNEGVKNLLATLHATNEPLTGQFQKMVSLYGTGGIVDAADLDQIGRDLPDFITTPGGSPTKQLLQKKPAEGGEMPLKDESDIESLRQAILVVNKRVHNSLTNKLRNCLSEYTLLEGRDKAAQFDALVKNYNRKGDDLLIEVKSSTDNAHVRMAIGQLFSYQFCLKGHAELHLAVLLPGEPNAELKRLLEWLKIGILWFTEDKLQSCNHWLEALTVDGRR